MQQEKARSEDAKYKGENLNTRKRGVRLYSMIQRQKKKKKDTKRNTIIQIKAYKTNDERIQS